MRRMTLLLAVLPLHSYAFAADPNAGKVFFHQQCALCHSAAPDDGGGAQGPNLSGVFGRRAAGGAGFSYTKALSGSGLIWDSATLDRFLAAPETVVPGSAMAAAVPDKNDRENLIAYFEALKAGTFKPAPAAANRVSPQDLAEYLAGFGCRPPQADIERAAAGKIADIRKLVTDLGCKLPETGTGTAEWKRDVPGRRHRIDVAHLPPPFATPAAVNPPQIVDRPPGAKLAVPAGFHVEVFARGLTAPRRMCVAPNGDVFVAETTSGRVKVMRPSSDGSKAQSTTIFAQGLIGPFGMAFYPNENAPQWLYVAENNRVVRYAYKTGDMEATGVPEVVIAQLAPTSGGHTTRDIAFSPDGKHMFVSVGSASNVAEGMPKKTPDEIKAWEAGHGLGAAWGPEENRADVLVFDVGADKPGKIFASGIRNCVGLTIEPRRGDLWCTTNERDKLGDDLVPDYSTRVKEAGFYGWPWYYMGQHEDPRLKGDRPDLAGKVATPDVLYQAHSAALSLVFYPANSGPSAFPKDYAGDGFAVLHGSWNRAHRAGHKVVRIRMKNGVPTGAYEDFMIGFIIDDSHVWGRPVGAAVAADGSLLVSDDAANQVYRISYSKGRPE